MKLLSVSLSFFLIISFFSASQAAAIVTDEIGRKVEIKNIPQRIVSLAPGITETLYAMNLDHKIVGVTSYCNWPVAAKQKRRIGGFINPSIETIISLKPDLIIATADGNRKDTIEQLERVGLVVYVTNPVSTKGILNSILRIGEITSEQKTAQTLTARLQKRLNNINKQTQRKVKPRVFFQIGLEPVVTVGRGSLINEAIELAGGLNIAWKEKARYPRYSAESLMAGAPDIILFAPMVNDKEFAAVKKFWQKYTEIPAVKNNRIYPIETDLISRASPRIIDAIEKMAVIFHPELTIAR
jgi:iron complex transport system substrate-binding protein